MSNPFSGARCSNYYCLETVPGEVNASPVWIQIQSTGGMPSLIKDTIESNVLDPSREKTGVRVGNEQAQGEFGVELSMGGQDALIANAMSSAFVAGIDQAAVDITVDNSIKSFTRAAGSFVTDGVKVGDLTRFSGLTGTNAEPFIVTEVSDLYVIGAGIKVDLTAETATTAYQTGKKVGTGSLCGTMSVLTWLRGSCGTVDKYIVTKGVEFSGFSFEIAVNAQVTGSFPFLGRSMDFLNNPPAGSTFSTKPLARPFAGVDGKILVNGELKALVTTVSITNDNAASAQFEIGDKGAAFIERGQASNTISLSAFMGDTDLLQAFKDEVETSFHIIVNGPNGSMSFGYDTAFLTAATAELSGPNSVTQTLEGVGIGSQDKSSLYIQVLPAL